MKSDSQVRTNPRLGMCGAGCKSTRPPREGSIEQVALFRPDRRDARRDGHVRGNARVATARAGAAHRGIRFTTLPGLHHRASPPTPARPTPTSSSPSTVWAGPSCRRSTTIRACSSTPTRTACTKRRRCSATRCGTVRACGSTAGRSTARARPARRRPPAQPGQAAARAALGTLSSWRTPTATMPLTRSRQLAAFVGGIQEHGPHAIRRGPDGEMTIIIGNNTFVADESRIDPRVAVPRQPRVAVPPGAARWPRVRPEHEGRAPRHASSLQSRHEDVHVLVGRAAQRLRPRVQPRRRSLHVRQRHGVGHQHAVVPRRAHGPPHARQRQRLQERLGQVPVLLPRHAAAGARPRARFACRRGVLSAPRLPEGVPRRVPRSRLVARAPPLDAARAGRRRLYARPRRRTSSCTASR